MADAEKKHIEEVPLPEGETEEDNEIIRVRVADLKPYKNNPRINDAAIGPTQSSIEDAGYRSMIIVNEDLEIIAGHTRLEALKRMGRTTVKVMVCHDMTKAQQKLYRLTDNKTSEFSAWDFTKLPVELDDLKDKFDLGNVGFGVDLMEQFSRLPDSNPIPGSLSPFGVVGDAEEEEEEPVPAVRIPSPEGSSAFRCGDVVSMGVHTMVVCAPGDEMLRNPGTSGCALSIASGSRGADAGCADAVADLIGALTEDGEVVAASGDAAIPVLSACDASGRMARIYVGDADTAADAVRLFIEAGNDVGGINVDRGGEIYTLDGIMR